MDEDDAFFDKCLEGAAMFALNQGEVCTCPSRILVQESIADAFIERLVARVNAIKVGNPLDSDTMVGAQASNDPVREDPALPQDREGGGAPRCWRAATS